MWLIYNSDAEKSVRLYVGFPGSDRVKSKFLCQDADVLSLADKCIVVGCFVCGYCDNILIDKFSDNIRVSENGLVSGVDRVLKSSNSTF